MLLSPRWLEVSVACPDCAESVQVWSATAQPSEDDDGVWLTAGDTWRCEAGHFGSVVVSGRELAHLGLPAAGMLVTVDEVEERYARVPSIPIAAGRLAHGSRP